MTTSKKPLTLGGAIKLRELQLAKEQGIIIDFKFRETPVEFAVDKDGELYPTATRVDIDFMPLAPVERVEFKGVISPELLR